VKPSETSSNACNGAVTRPHATRRQRTNNRRAEASTRPTTSDPHTRSLLARSPRGELQFRLQYHQGGLYVEREEIPCRGLHCVHSMHFRDVRQFEQWCDRDPARFEHPLLHLALKRDAGSLWQLREQPDA
jgi:hypothetical protein